MQMEVLKFIHTDYEVIVRTQDIAYSWERFRGRIISSQTSESPEEYCRYTSKDNCSLCIYNPITQSKNILVEGMVWDKLWPVIYETCRYQIRILFHGVDEEMEPEVRHVRKDIEDSFFCDTELQGASEKSLTGDIDFLNEPGVFKLDFTYKKNGKTYDSFVTFDVVSPKLDTKGDYKTLLSEVNEEYENVIYRYLSITVQQFSRGRVNNDSTWMSAFQGVIDDYVKNVKRIIQNPHSQIVKHRASCKAEQMKYWTSAMEERYGEVKSEGKLEEYYFSFDETHSTYDTMENRFVKHTLVHIGKRLNAIISTVLNCSQEYLSVRHREIWIGYREDLRKLARHPFFRSIGRFEGLSQESLVLQSRNGYQQIYKDWLKLKRGIDFYDGAANIGTLQIWEIYELWCFIKMKRLVAEVMGINPNMPDYEKLVTEPKGTLLNPFTNSSLEHVVEYRYPSASENDSTERKEQLAMHEGDIVTLHYQHTFNRRSGNNDDGMGINTATTEQRPDIVLNIRKDSGETVLTYLYDAKYRVINDKRLDRDFEQQDIDEEMIMPGGDYPPTDAINQMHRYRDAIYYSKEEPYRSKEIIGGYILFPGRGNDEYIKRRYYSESIRSVNIGAFPLLPNKSDLLKSHLHEILMTYTSSEIHVSKARPQRTLAYVTEEEKAAMMTEDLVMVALTGSKEKRQWTFDNQWYNIPLDKIANMPWMKAKYLLLYCKGEKQVGNICKIVRSKHDVWTGGKLIDNGYPGKPSHPAYFMIRIIKPSQTDIDLRDAIFDIQNIMMSYPSAHKLPFFLVKLKDLRNNNNN